ncbi:MAG TPA: hypothetical protein VGE72_23890 [Azospirillum sp.]
MQDHKDCAGVCRVLAAQLAEVQARFETSSGELMATLDRLDALLSDEGDAAAREAPTLQSALDGLLLVQAQEHDIIRQMMGVVTRALSLLPDGIDVEGLSGLYVSDVQRQVHSAVVERGDAA